MHCELRELSIFDCPMSIGLFRDTNPDARKPENMVKAAIRCVMLALQP